MGNSADFSHLAEKKNESDSDAGNGCGCISLILFFLIGGLLGWLNRS
jgi:hypothetical protein